MKFKSKGAIHCGKDTFPHESNECTIYILQAFTTWFMQKRDANHQEKVITRVLGLTYAPCMDTYTNSSVHWICCGTWNLFTITTFNLSIFPSAVYLHNFPVTHISIRVSIIIPSNIEYSSPHPQYSPRLTFDMTLLYMIIASYSHCIRYVHLRLLN